MTENAGGGLPPLPTTVVGSYSVPEWLERLKTEYYQRRISAAHLTEIHEVAIKAAVKDQERAGIDIVSDGELRRDNDIDYFLARIPGVHIAQRAKSDYYDYYDAAVSAPLPPDAKDVPGLGLAGDFEFTRALTDRPVKFSFTGPFSLSRRLGTSAYNDQAELVRALARRLNAEARALAEAGADLALGARRADRLAETSALVEKTGRRAIAVTTDVTRPEDCQGLVEAAMAEFGWGSPPPGCRRPPTRPARPASSG